MTTPCESKYDIEKLSHAIYGNGKIGMKTEIEIIKMEVKDIKESIDSLGTSYAALAKNQLEIDLTEKMKLKTWNRIAIIFGISIPLTALIIEWL